MNPTCTAVGMKRAMNPIPAKPRMRKTTPTRIASAADNGPLREASSSAIAATSEAEIAAVDEVGLTISCLDVPSSPYPASPAAAAYSPVSGGRPAIWA